MLQGTEAGPFNVLPCWLLPSLSPFLSSASVTNCIPQVQVGLLRDSFLVTGDEEDSLEVCAGGH